MSVAEVLEECVDHFAELIVDAEADDDDDKAEHYAQIVEVLEGLLTEANAVEFNAFPED